MWAIAGACSLVSGRVRDRRDHIRAVVVCSCQFSDGVFPIVVSAPSRGPRTRQSTHSMNPACFLKARPLQQHAVSNKSRATQRVATNCRSLQQVNFDLLLRQIAGVDGPSRAVSQAVHAASISQGSACLYPHTV